MTSGGAANEPVGDGDMALVVNATGGFTMGGMLADGAPYTRSGWVSANGLIPFYAPYGAGKSLAMGWINVGANLSGTIYWSKPTFETTLGLTGQTYVPPKGKNPAITLSNAVITLSGGDLTNAISAAFTFEPVARFVFPRGPANTNRISVTLNDANGAFTGQFYNPATHRAEGFRGVVLQSQNAGFGLVGSKGGLVTFGAAQ